MCVHMDLCVYLYICNMDMRRAWRLTPGFLPGESHGHRCLAAYPSTESQRVGHDRHNSACMQCRNVCAHVHVMCVCVSTYKYIYTETETE